MGPLHGWSWRLVGDGAVLAGPGGGSARIWQRQRPLRPIVDLVRDHVAARRLVDPKYAPIEQVGTAEGCLAALTGVTSAAGEIGLGFVFGEDFYELIEVEGDRSVLEALVRGHELGVDDRRALRFLYTPPPGWQGLARGQVTEWFPPEFQRDWAYIVVPPTLPGYHTPASLADRVQHFAASAGFIADEKSVREPLTTDNGLYGLIYRWRGHYPEGRHVLKMAATSTDRVYVYAARLEVNRDNERIAAHEETFMNLVRSIVPLPKRAAEPPDVFLPWRG